MEIDVNDAQAVFHLLDDGDGTLAAEEVVRGFAKLKGPARAADMCILLKRVDRIEEVLQSGGLMQDKADDNTHHQREKRDRLHVSLSCDSLDSTIGQTGQTDSTIGHQTG